MEDVMKITIKKHSILNKMGNFLSFNSPADVITVAELIERVICYQVNQFNRAPLNNLLFLPTPLLTQSLTDQIKSETTHNYHPAPYVYKAIELFRKRQYLLIVNGERVTSPEQLIQGDPDIEIQFIDLSTKSEL
jgi:hypothetical protein